MRSHLGKEATIRGASFYRRVELQMTVVCLLLLEYGNLLAQPL